MDLLQDVRYMTDMLHKLGEAKLMIDPRIRGMQKELFDSSILEEFHLNTADLLRIYWNDDQSEVSYQLFDRVLVSEKMLFACIYNFFLGTAVYISHDLKGGVHIDEDIAEMAVVDVKTFLNQQGLMNLFLCYRVIAGFESRQAIAYYGSMSEAEFLSGEKHRPGASDSLESELLIGLAADLYERVEVEGESYIYLTDHGRKRMNDEYKMLTDSKYMDFRMKVMYVSQFDQLHDWETMLEPIAPTIMKDRSDFLDFLDIRPGMEVLELGCGTGALTFEAGLAERVGKDGWVTATDPSTGMLHQAGMKLEKSGYQNVSFEAVAAEQIPYENHEFDCVLGVSFFHFTDNDQALAEMIRVTRPGGVIGLFSPVDFEWDVPFFYEWFEEIFALARGRKAAKPRNYLPKGGQLESLFKAKGLNGVVSKNLKMPWLFPDPETVVRFMVYGIGFFQRELILLPVAARRELIERLIEKGQDICEKYPENERVMESPICFVKGIV